MDESGSGWSWTATMPVTGFASEESHRREDAKLKEKGYYPVGGLLHWGPFHTQRMRNAQGQQVITYHFDLDAMGHFPWSGVAIYSRDPEREGMEWIALYGVRGRNLRLEVPKYEGLDGPARLAILVDCNNRSEGLFFYRPKVMD